MRILLCLGLIMFMNLAAGESIADLNNGLIAYYPFNGNANNIIDNKSNGTIEGATLTEDRFGNLNSAFMFDGNDYINLGKSAHLISDESFTFLAWINHSSPDEKWTTIISQWSGINDSFIETFWFGFLDESNNNQLVLGSEVSSNSSNCVRYTESPFPLNEWQHVAMTFNKSLNKLKIHNNGILVQEWNDIVCDFAVNETFPILIGAVQRETIVHYYKGSIDDLIIYNRDLSEPEILKIYNDGIQNCDFVADSDNDGVINTIDQCPDTALNSAVYSNGCRAQNLYDTIGECDLLSKAFEKVESNYNSLSITYANLAEEYIALSKTTSNMFRKEQVQQMISDILVWGDCDEDGKITLQEIIEKLMIITGIVDDQK